MTAIDNICKDLIFCRLWCDRRSLFNAKVYPTRKMKIGAAIEKRMRIAGRILIPKKQ